MTRDADTKRRVLVWDGPNMDHALTDVIGERASPATRPVMAAVYGWLAGLEGGAVEAAVFVTVPPGQESNMTPWVVSLRRSGFYVFVKQRQGRRDGVESDMLAHVLKRAQQGASEIIVASHDPKPFEHPLRRLVADGTPVTILGYRERNEIAVVDNGFGFVDLEDVPGAFTTPLPRTNLHDLPQNGRWLAPLEFPEPTDLSPDLARVRRSDVTESQTGTTDPGESDVIVDLTSGPLRVEVVGFVRELVQVTGATSVADIGAALRDRYPAATLPELGFGTVGALISEVTNDGSVTLLRNGSSHCLSPVESEAAETDTVAATEAPPAAVPDSAASSSPTSADNPIYTAFRSVNLDEAHT